MYFITFLCVTHRPCRVSAWWWPAPPHWACIPESAWPCPAPVWKWSRFRHDPTPWTPRGSLPGQMGNGVSIYSMNNAPPLLHTSTCWFAALCVFHLFLYAHLYVWNSFLWQWYTSHWSCILGFLTAFPPATPPPFIIPHTPCYPPSLYLPVWPSFGLRIIQLVSHHCLELTRSIPPIDSFSPPAVTAAPPLLALVMCGPLFSPASESHFHGACTAQTSPAVDISL